MLALGVPIELPNPWDPTKLWVTLALLGLLIFAFVMEAWRRRRQRHEHVASEWRSVREIARSRDLPEGDIPLLEAFLSRQAPQSPLRAVTVYREFDACVSREMTWARAHLDEKAYENHGICLRDIRHALRLDYVPFGQQIRSTRELPEGQAIWGVVGETAETPWQRLKIARVNEAWFALESGKGHGTLAVSAGDTVRLRLWREDDARYLFEASVLRVEESPGRWLFRHTTQLRRVQARAHFRVRYAQSVEVAVMSAPRDGNFENAETRPIITTLRGRVTSLSGGGLAVMLDQPLPAQVMLGLALRIESESIPVFCRIVHTAPVSRGRYIVRGAFVNMDDEVRDQISRYTLHQQQAAISDEDEATWA